MVGTPFYPHRGVVYILHRNGGKMTTSALMWLVIAAGWHCRSLFFCVPLVLPVPTCERTRESLDRGENYGPGGTVERLSFVCHWLCQCRCANESERLRSWGERRVEPDSTSNVPAHWPSQWHTDLSHTLSVPPDRRCGGPPGTGRDERMSLVDQAVPNRSILGMPGQAWQAVVCGEQFHLLDGD